MNNNGFDSRDDFYSGYDNNSQNGGGFYGGYDNNSQNGGRFYTGYDDNKEDTYADPFSGGNYNQNAGLSEASQLKKLKAEYKLITESLQLTM